MYVYTRGGARLTRENDNNNDNENNCEKKPRIYIHVKERADLRVARAQVRCVYEMCVLHNDFLYIYTCIYAGIFRLDIFIRL